MTDQTEELTHWKNTGLGTLGVLKLTGGEETSLSVPGGGEVSLTTAEYRLNLRKVKERYCPLRSGVLQRITARTDDVDFDQSSPNVGPRSAGLVGGPVPLDLPAGAADRAAVLRAELEKAEAAIAAQQGQTTTAPDPVPEPVVAPVIPPADATPAPTQEPAGQDGSIATGIASTDSPVTIIGDGDGELVELSPIDGVPTDEDLKKIINAKIPELSAKLKEITNPALLNRMLAVAVTDGASKNRRVLIQDRLDGVSQPPAPTRGQGGPVSEDDSFLLDGENPDSTQGIRQHGEDFLDNLENLPGGINPGLDDE